MYLRDFFRDREGFNGVEATDRFSVRAFQVDYNPTRFGGTTQNNFRFGIGIVFH